MATTEPLSTKDLLLKGSKGIKVSQLQDALLAYPIKFSIPESSAIKALRGALTAAPASKGLYGNLTEAAVKDFQNYVRNTLDKTVIVDGKAGPITLPFLLGQPPQQAPTQPSNTYTPITIQQASGKGTFRTITGVVRDKITQQPMANVDVFFNPDPNNNTFVFQTPLPNSSVQETSSIAKTNKDGKFSIDVTEYIIFYAGGVLPDPNQNLQLNNTQSVTFLEVAPDLASIQTVGSYTSLPKENQDEVRNHLKITFGEVNEFVLDKSKKSKRNKTGGTSITYKYVGPNNENYIVPFDGPGNWKLSLGDIYLTPSTGGENQLSVIKNKQITKEQRDKLFKNPKLRDILSKLIEETTEYLKQRLISLLFKQLSRLGINNPEEIIDTLKQFDALLAAEAEKASSPQEIQRQIKEAEERIFAYQSNLANPFAPASILAESTQKIEEENKKIKDLQAQLSGQPTAEVYNPYTNVGQPNTIGGEINKNLAKQNLSTQDELGITAVKGIKENADQLKNKNTQNAVSQKLSILIARNLINIKPKCPPDDVISDIISIRNSLTRQLNNNNKILLNVQKAISIFNKAITVFQQAKIALLAALAAVPAPAAVLTSGIISAAQDAKQLALDKFSNQILKIKAKIEPLEKKLLNLLFVLDKILLILALLDAFIQQCAENNNIPLEQVSQDLIDATQQAGLNGNGIVSNTGEVAPGVSNNYKGFTLEIAEEQTDNKYKRRFAQARNIQGIVVLKGAPSFSSNAQILIDEIKFLIDSNNLRAD
jgi:hypothetical protein